MDFSSKLLENAVNEISQLPGIGKRTALRLALHMLKQPTSRIHGLSNALSKMVDQVSYCKNCHNISDFEMCEICANPKRSKNMICIVEDIRDVMAIENTQHFKGTYHVLGGRISPMEGVGPHNLNIFSLIKKIDENPIEEIILALSSTIEGDTTNFYIYKQLEKKPIKISVLSKGISIGGELEYADEITLGRSILNRVLFEPSLRQGS